MGKIVDYREKWALGSIFKKYKKTQRKLRVNEALWIHAEAYLVLLKPSPPLHHQILKCSVSHSNQGMSSGDTFSSSNFLFQKHWE